MKIFNIRPLILCLYVLLASCAAPLDPSLGDKISGPFAVAGQPGTRNVFVLNAAFTGEYRNGSIVRFELNEKLDSLVKREFTETPRLGSELAFSADGKILAALFQDRYSRVKIFKVSAAGALTDLGVEFSPGLRLSQLQFFSPTENAVGDYFLTVVEDNVAATAKTSVLKLTTTADAKLSKLATFPDDLPYPNPETYSFGYAAPSYIRADDLLVFMPQGVSGIAPDLPDPVATLNGKVAVTSEKYDLRYVSALVLDWGNFIKSKNIAGNTGFVPLVYKPDGSSPNLSKPLSDAANSGVSFRSGYYTSAAINQNNCLVDGAAAQDANAPADAMLSFDLASQDVTSFFGWKSIRAALAELPSKNGEKHSERLIFSGLKISVYSKKKGVPEIDTEEASRVSKISVGKLGEKCVPVWLRTELQRSSRGEEISRLSLNFGKAAKSPILRTLEDRGSNSFGLLSVGETSRLFAFSVSYSYGTIRAFEVTKELKIVPLK